MPRFFSVVHKAGLIGDWHRGEIFPKVALLIVLRQPALLSSATPSETKNTYFCGEPAVPGPGVLIAVLIWGNMVVKPVSSALLSFWPLTVITSMAPAAVLALLRLDDSANSARRACVSDEAPKS